MIRVWCSIVLLLLTARATAVVHYHDATHSKALVDAYVQAVAEDDETQAYLLGQQIVTSLYTAYDKQVYLDTLHYLHSLEGTHPDAVLSLSDSLQAYWDSNYLQSYLVGSAAEYGKLKFLATIGIVGGGLGLWKNPLASFASLQGLNFLLPLAGGVGTYYAVEFFRQPLPDVPLEPRQVLSFAEGARYFSYAEKRNDYLYRLFSVGIGLGSGEFIFKALGNDWQRRADSKTKGDSSPPSKGITVVDEAAEAAREQQRRQASRPQARLFRPQASFSYWARAAGAVLGIYLLQKGVYHAVREIDLRRAERELHAARQDFNAARHGGEPQTLIVTAKQLVTATVSLVTLYEMPQLQAMVEFEQQFSQQAAQLHSNDEELRNKLQEMTLKLSKSLQSKLTRALAAKNYRYDTVPLLHVLAQSSYTQLKNSSDTRIVALIEGFEQEHAEEVMVANASGDTAGLDEKLASWVELTQSDRYAEARQRLQEGKLQRNIELLFQVASLFKESAGSDRAFLQHFHHQLLAKFQNMLTMYRNFEAIIDHNAVWQIKFSAAELSAVIDLYLDYAQASSAATSNNATVSVPQQGRTVLTTTRGFARFLASYIADLPTKSYNQLLLRMLDIYQEQPQHRAALVVLLQDVEEQAELHDSYYDTVWLLTLEGSFIGAGVLMVTRMAAKLAHVLGADVAKPQWQWIAKLLGMGGVEAVDPEKGMRLMTRRHWGQLGKVAYAGAVAGYLYYFAQKLRTHKLPPQAALFDMQKDITLELAYRTCVLAHEVNARAQDRAVLETYSAAQLEQERVALTGFAVRLNAIRQQAVHLNESAPSLRGNHLVLLPQDLRGDERCSSQVTDGRMATVSIVPLAQDIEHTTSTLRQWQQTMNSIEQRRLQGS